MAQCPLLLFFRQKLYFLNYTSLGDRPLLKAYYPSLKDKYHLRSLELFGLVARGDSSAKDVNLLIAYDECFSLYYLMDLKAELENLLNEKVDMACKNSFKEHISEDVSKNFIAI